jgi:glycosyltransferase involved in cell wall biosynthesis
MINLVLPLGSTHGWGVCGKYITKEMSRLTPVRLFTGQFTVQQAGDELDYSLLRPLIANAALPEDVAACASAPMLQGITSAELAPCMPGLRGSRTLGYTFFEQTLLPAVARENARRWFDLVVAGSTWCEEVLRAHGFTDVATVIQGIDPAVFHPSPLADSREYFDDRFVVFSGGKAELRKGQDLVIRAYKVLQDRHHDVLLINSWYNAWPTVFQTLGASPYITFRLSGQDHASIINNLLHQNGIDVDRVLTLGPKPNLTMPRIYYNSDVGLFPNRCEGGTNLVLMEYMACGKPVIASWSSGHKDVLTPENALPIRSMGSMAVRQSGQDLGEWDDPNLEETIELLERAYQNRDSLRALGRQAAADMGRLTWRRTAEAFIELLTGDDRELLHGSGALAFVR